MREGPAGEADQGAEVKRALREWVCRRSTVEIADGGLHDRTPLIESGYLTSLEVTELILLIEELRGRPLDPASLQPGVFRDIDTIHATFFAGPAR